MLIITRITSPRANVTRPENSCKKPCAISPPYFEARNAVKVNLIMLSRTAIGAAVININHFFCIEQIVNQAITALKANIVVRDRRPEQASTTSSVVWARWRILPSRNTAMPVS